MEWGLSAFTPLRAEGDGVQLGSNSLRSGGQGHRPPVRRPPPTALLSFFITSDGVRKLLCLDSVGRTGSVVVVLVRLLFASAAL